MTSLVATALDSVGLVATAGTRCGFILDTVTEEGAEFEIVRARDLREVILPDEEIFVILPRRLVPQLLISAGTPEKWWRTHSCVRCCVRKNRGKLSKDIFDEPLAL